jgi:hypothetical protein
LKHEVFSKSLALLNVDCKSIFFSENQTNVQANKNDLLPSKNCEPKKLLGIRKIQYSGVEKTHRVVNRTGNIQQASAVAASSSALGLAAASALGLDSSAAPLSWSMASSFVSSLPPTPFTWAEFKLVFIF